MNSVVFFAFLLIHTVVGFPFKKGDDAKSSYLVSDLPGLKDIPELEVPLMFSGQLELYPENNTHLYFWKYHDNHVLPENENKTIFWLNGGPGCSSMDGALMEAGPFRVGDNGKIQLNNGSWHKAGNIVFVDQPVGTGFSYGKEYDHDLNEVGWQFLQFMHKFFEVFPEDKHHEIYFAGESYAGQYIPYIAKAVLDYNHGHPDNTFDIRGLLIGNGWIAPDVQSLSYLPYSVAAGIITTDNSEWLSILKQHEKCQKVVNDLGGNSDHSMSDFQVVSQTCEVILNLILSATRNRFASEDQQCYNMYDYTLKDSYPSCGMNWPPDLKNVNPFLNSKEVQGDLNLIHHRKWRECSSRVGHFFDTKHSVPAVKLLPELLEQVPIVLFNGNRDIICNYVGTENFIKEMTWGSETGFKDSLQYDWIYDNETTGYIKTERNLTFVNIFDSSHMVPFDKPEVSRSLMDLVLGNYDVKDLDEVGGVVKKGIITYPLGMRKVETPEEPQRPEKPQKPTSSQSPQTTQSQTGSPTTSTYPSSSSSPIPEDQSALNKITRVIQFVLIIILIWGVYMLYSAYKSKPASIIKSGTSTSGRKKNVQWADQLRQFQQQSEEEENQGFLKKALNRFRKSDPQGEYALTNNEAYEDIEMENNLSMAPEDFVIDSDEEHERNIDNNRGKNGV